MSMKKSTFVNGLADMLGSASVVEIDSEKAKLAMPTGQTRVKMLGEDTSKAIVGELRVLAEYFEAEEGALPMDL